VTPRFFLKNFPLAMMRIIFAFKALYSEPKPWSKDRLHWGVDLEAFFVPVMAMLEGIVIRASRFDPVGWGYYITILHAGGYQTIYAHLSRVDVKEGDKVEAGQLIGVSGDSGSAENFPHLHLELRKEGAPDAGPRGQLNPLIYIQAQPPDITPPPVWVPPGATPPPAPGLPAGIEDVADQRLRYTVQAAGLRIRNGPGQSYVELGQHQPGAEVGALRVYIPVMWVEFEPGKWSAARFDGDELMKLKE